MHPASPTFRTLTSAACLTMAITLLTGCEKHTAPPPITIAATATSHEPAPAINQALRDLLTQHAREARLPGDAKVGLLTQGNQPVTIDITPMRGEEVETDPTRAGHRIEENIATLEDQLATATAADRGLDLLDTYAKAIDVTPADGTIVLISSGVTTADPISLSKAGDWSTRPARLANRIPAVDIPDGTGRHVILSGIGYTAGDQKPPPTAAAAALSTLWTRICTRSGAATCTIQSGPAGTQPPIATNRVPMVEFVRPDTPCVDTITIEADLAFDADSAVLTPEADRQLEPLASRLDQCSGDRLLHAHGHAAEVPGGGDGVALSTERAQAVLDRLRALGAPRRVLGSAVGYGSTSHQIVDNTPDGTYDETLARRNRVVVLSYATR